MRRADRLFQIVPHFRGGRLVASEVGRAVWSDTFAVGFLRE